MKLAYSKIIGLAMAALVFACSVGDVDPGRATIGPVTESVDLADYSAVYYVAKWGNDEADGSKIAPWSSIQFAQQTASANPNGRVAILVGEGLYGEGTLAMAERVDLFGGYAENNWVRDIAAHRTVLDGRGAERIMIGANNSRIDGFVFANGVVRGKGAALICDGVSPIISNNVFTNNKSLSPKGWAPRYRHEISNDGGAIYVANNANPTVVNNLFAENLTENGRGAGIALHNRCNGIIANNVFYNNVTGLDDPLRSSDGGAISIFDWSSPVVENNIILSNKSLANNDAGGVFIALWSAPEFKHNILVDNECTDDAGALFIGGQEHRYDSPLDPIPGKEDFYIKVVGNEFYGNRNPSGNSGVLRMTMESRGLIANNIMAFNNGFYIQRSEATIVNNTIMENFLFIETKDGLLPSYAANNIVWGDFSFETVATVEYNNFRDGYEGTGNFSAGPQLDNEVKTIKVASSEYSNDHFTTRLGVQAGSITEGDLTNRTVRAGDKWGVVRNNDAESITVWGDLSGIESFDLIPTYHLKAGSANIDKGTDKHLWDTDFDGDSRPQGAGVDIGADEYTD